MSYADELPKDVAHFLVSQYTAEYASVSAAGLGFDTPTLYFPSDDLSTLDLATGLAYPIKAERPRRNPKVGLLVEGGPDSPVVSVAGLATVRDSDFQANLERYIAETIITPVLDPKIVPWADVQKAVWYLTRIMICITPTHIRWWKNLSSMDEPPQEWRAPVGTAAPASDPPAPGKPSEPAKWPQPPWPELAAKALGSGDPGHLTLLDDEGYPIPLRVRDLRQRDGGFDLVAPRGAPWRSGPGTLSFRGREIFVGEARLKDGRGVFDVERALPVLPMTEDYKEVIYPTDATKAELLRRLRHELERRGKSVPVVPPTPPKPSIGAQRRLDALAGAPAPGNASATAAG
jgi:hypothetical protein